MNEKPILFSDNMVRAVLNGRKTQTRRVIRLHPRSHIYDGKVENSDAIFRITSEDKVSGKCKMIDNYRIPCPHGGIGDRLWVRETWKISSHMEGEPVEFQYRSDGTILEENSDFTDCLKYEDWYDKMCERSTHELEQLGLEPDEWGMYYWKRGESPLKWIPSIFMPRWASRINLEITNIRVERVQEISIDDIYAEGCKSISCSDEDASELYEWFSELWNSINKKRGYGWDDNPWVWVIEFKRTD